jgi:hypothetical protein
VKFGVLRTPRGEVGGIDGRPVAVKNFAAYSLRRLGTEVIDIYQPARVDPAVPLEDTIGAISDLIREGKVRYLGVSELSAEQLERAHRVHPVSGAPLGEARAGRPGLGDVARARHRDARRDEQAQPLAGDYSSEQARAEELAREIRALPGAVERGQTAAVFPCNIARPAEIERLFEAARAELGHIDATTPDDDAYLAQMTRATPLGRLGTPDDVANAVLLLVSPLAGFITGHHLSADGGAAL